MARLFITPREIDLISDITKELTKDIIGQVIYYYKPRVDLSTVNDTYDEMIERVFDPPVEIDCTIERGPSTKTTDRFGHQSLSEVTLYLHYRDLLDRGIAVEEGDFFQYGPEFYEMTTVNRDKTMFGQVEHITGYRIVAKQARQGLINKPRLGPTGEQYLDKDSVQRTFTQQRGSGNTGDKRELVKNGTVDSPIGTPQIVKPSGTVKSGFYGDDS
jgi:hypothetical protein